MQTKTECLIDITKEKGLLHIGESSLLSTIRYENIHQP